MVDYSCSICKKNYGSSEEASKQAEECQKKGLIGPDIKQGVLFSHKDVKDGFLIFYNELKSEGHNRVYHLEEIVLGDILTYRLQDFKISNPNLKKWLEEYNVATDEEVSMINEKIENEFKGTGPIKAYMDRFEIKKLHNDFDLERYLNEK